MWTRQELKFRAKQAYTRNYGNAVGAAFVMGLFSTSFTTVIENYQSSMDQSEGGLGQIYNTYLQSAFVLELSFIGWEILSSVTCGILGILMVRPYREATLAELYRENKEKAFREGYIR